QVVLTKGVDKASPKLFMAAAAGTRFPTVTIAFYRNDAGGLTQLLQDQARGRTHRYDVQFEPQPRHAHGEREPVVRVHGDDLLEDRQSGRDRDRHLLLAIGADSAARRRKRALSQRAGSTWPRVDRPVGRGAPW